MITKLKFCRICKQKNVEEFLPLGNIPLPNGFIKREDLKLDEPRFPLRVGACADCGLVQLMDIVDPEAMFRNYVYIPSTSKTRMNNFAQIANDARERFKINQNSLVIDIGSNDGSLLSFFKGYGIRVLGIDPATNLAKVAELKGIETINDYISVALAGKIKKTKGPARVITATNVVAHINDLHDLLKSVQVLLEDDGVFICEFPYLLDLIENNQFDTIYHEHLSYFSIKPLIRLLEVVGLEMTDVIRTPIDGGSLRVFIQKKQKRGKKNVKIEALLKNEIRKELYNKKTLDDFAKRVKNLKTELRKTLMKLKKSNKKIVAYGAAAKGNILLNYCNIGTSLIDFAVDSTPYKQGLYMPGTHIRIFPEAEITKRKPDYILVLAWNFAKEIMDKERKYKELGGKFIIPVPAVKVV